MLKIQKGILNHIPIYNYLLGNPAGVTFDMEFTKIADETFSKRFPVINRPSGHTETSWFEFNEVIPSLEFLFFGNVNLELGSYTMNIYDNVGLPNEEIIYTEKAIVLPMEFSATTA